MGARLRSRGPSSGKEKAAPREAARAEVREKSENPTQDAPRTGVRQGGARKEKAAHEGRPEFRTFSEPAPDSRGAGARQGGPEKGPPPRRPESARS